MCNINEKSETIKLILKNSSSNFVIGESILSYPVKIIQSNDCIPEQNEWEKECISYLVKVYEDQDFTIYENVTFGSYIITDVTHDKKIIALTYQDFYDLNQSITKTTFAISDNIYVFDNDFGLFKQIWNIN